MRALLLAAGATLAISACNSGDTAENAVNVGDNVAAEDIVANDTTAIDAATNEAANMAEESEVALPPLDDESAEETSPAPRRTVPRPPTGRNETPTSNSAVANTATNAE